MVSTEAELELAKRARSGSIGQIALIAIFAYATGYYQSHPAPLAIAGAAIVLFNLLRLYLSFGQTAFFPYGNKVWDLLFAASVLIPAASWGILFLRVLIYDGLSNYPSLVSVLIASGICAAITTSVSPRQNLARGYLTLVIGPPLAHLIADMDRQSTSLALIFIAYYWFLWNQVRIQNEIFWESVRSRNRLTGERNRIEAVLDAVPGLIAWVGADLKYHGVNRNYALAFGSDPESFAGKNLGFLHPNPDYVRAVHGFVESSLDHFTCEVMLTSHGEWRTHLLVMRKILEALPEKSEILTYLICIDIHQLKEAQSELEKQRVKNDLSSKLAALGETTATVAHEIKNPLSAILISGELIRRELGRPEARPDAIGTLAERIISTAKRIEKIIAGLSKFSRTTEEEPFLVSRLSQIIEDTIDLVSEHFKMHHVSLQTQNIDEDVLLRCRAVEISQVLLNLLNNGLDAVKGQAGERWVRLEVHRTDGSVSIAIVDSGCGIPPEIRKRIFEQFFTTKPPGRGTGLGLSVSQKIIERHGGKLRLEPSAKHTTFLITLPAVADRRKGKAAA